MFEGGRITHDPYEFDMWAVSAILFQGIVLSSGKIISLPYAIHVPANRGSSLTLVSENKPELALLCYPVT